MRETAVRWLKFNLVGTIGILVQLGTLAFLTHGLCVNYLFATAAAVETAVLHNFLWHERFTWADRVRISVRESLTRFVKYNLTIGLFSILGNVAFMWLFVGESGLPYLPANLIAIALCSLMNFIVSNWFIFTPFSFRSVTRIGE